MRVIVYSHNIVHCATRTFEVCLLSLAWIRTPRYLSFCQIRQGCSTAGFLKVPYPTNLDVILGEDHSSRCLNHVSETLTIECGLLHKQYFLKGCQIETKSATRTATILHWSAKPLPA